MTVSILTFNADDIPGIGGGVGGDSLFDSLIWQESRGRQTDAKGAPITSTKGAIGIAQVMPNTAPEAAALAGLPFDDVKYRTDPVYNKALGRAYFDKQLADFGDPAKALGAYNAGPGAMRRALATAEKAGNPDAWMQYLPAETQAYIPSILKKAGMTPGATSAAGPDYYKPSTTRYATLPPPVPERSTPQAFADAGLALASGVVSGAGLIANVAGADNPVARTLDDTAKSIDAMSSPARKAQQAARGETIRQAEATGDTWKEIQAYGGAFAEAPIETILNAVGTSAPTLLMGLIPGLAQAQAVRLIARGAVGAAQGAGSVKGAIYDAVTKKLVDGGMHPDEAQKVAAGAQAYDSVNGGHIAIGALIGFPAGATGAEAAIARIASGGAAKAGGRIIGKRVALGVAKESPVEFVQDAQERGASNVALQNEGFDVPTMQGVIGQGTLAALASAPMGAVAGALDKNVPPALAPVADAADKPDSPLSRAAVAGNTGPAADAARNAAAADAAATNIDPATRLAELEAISKGTPDITNADGVTIAGDPGRFFTAEEQAEYKDLKARQATSTEASGADPLSEKAARISDAIREKGALDALRSEDAPVDAQEVLKDLAIAQSKSTPAARREQAMNRLEFALAWAGIHPADKVAPLGAKLDANGVPTGSPADINLADRRAAIDAATAPRAPAPQPEGQTYDGTQAAERAAAADKELQQDNLKAAAKPAPLPPADAVMAALKVIPALRTAEQTALVKQAEARYSLADMRVLEMGANYQAGMSATDKIQLERLRGVDSPGIVGPDKPSVSQKATDDAQKATIGSDPAPQNEQIATPAVATPSGAGPAVLRKRRAVLAQVVELGLSRVERRGEEYFLTNGKKDFKLEGAADAQLARKAIQDAIRTGAEQANTEQTAAQALAGNYKKGRVEFDGLKLGIETPVGKSRTDKANDPPKWSTKMELAHYGDVTGTTGADGDGVDVYLVNNPRAGSPVFVIDQYKGDAFDETKSILGVATEAEALRIYDAGFSDGSGPSRRRAVTKMTVEEFKKWAFSAAAEKPAGSENGKTGSTADGAGDQGAGKQLPDIAGGVAAGGDGKVRPARANGNAAAGKPDAGGAKPAPAGDGGGGSNVTIQVDGKPVTVQTVGADELGAESSAREGRPSRKITKQNAELLQRLVAMFGKEVVFFKDPFGEIGDGFVEPGRDRTIFLNESSGISPLEVFGHELLHQIEISHPEIHAAIKKVVVAHLGENAPHQFRNDYHGRKAGPNSNAPLDNNDINELVSDLGGSMLSDAKFWREVFAQIETDNPGKSKGLIARLADLFYAMVDRLVAGIKQTGYRAGKLDVDANSNDFINDMKAVRAAFREGLAKYIADNGITRTAMQAEILRAGVKQSKDRETTKNEISAIKKAREVLDNLRGEINPERGYADELEDDVQKAIDTIDSGGATPTMIREILDNLRGEINPERGYADELERDIIQAITTIDALDVAGSTAKRSTARESVTNTPEFKEWFGDSKVVDDEGKPLVVYHGTATTMVGDSFDPNLAMSEGGGFYFSHAPLFKNPANNANEYAKGRAGDSPQIMPVYLRMENPLIVGFNEPMPEGDKAITAWLDRMNAFNRGLDRDKEGYYKRAIREARTNGHDGVIVRNVEDVPNDAGRRFTDEADVYIALKPEQIKSATGNNGDFDANSGDITRSPDRESATPTTGIHFSKEPRTRLDGAYYGRGMKGAEAKRLQNTDDQRLKERVYVYIDEGKGVRPEDGVGSYAHEVKLPKLYDAQENPNGLWKGSDLNATESAILDAGYGGYYVRDIGNNQGAAVVLGEASRDLKVKPLPDYIKGAAPAPAPATEASKALMSKELAQLDVSRIPGARVKSGTLTVPLDSVQEANEEMARINSDIRFSKTRETDEDFEESSIVDSDGNLVTLYHGTAGIGDQAIEEFRLGHGLYGAGIYLTEYPNRAEAYAIGDRGHVYPVKASITNPYDADDFLDRYGKGTKTKARANEIREELIAEGYDGIVDRSMNKFWEVIAFHPEQIKFALDMPAKDIQRSRNREGMKPEIVETAGQVLRYLTPSERIKLRRDTAQTLVDIFKKLPSGNEMAAVAFAGKAKRGWYHNSARALEHVFGHDAPRFAALLAAMSPQTSVEVNLRNALSTWKNWVEADRPTSRGKIFEIMGRSVEGSRLTDSVLPAWVPNSVRALTAEDPTQIILSGPKVNSFMLNLRGVVEEVTNDAWMANYAAVDQRIFSGSLNAAGTDPGKGPGYMAMSAKAREAARKLTQLTGDEWTPAEVQETVWSWAKTLYELQSKDVGARELLDNKAVTDDLIASTPDFSSQLHEAKNEETLKRAGYGDQLGSLRSRADLAAARDQESTPSGQAGPFDPETQDRLERRAASRLEQLRDDRAAAEAVTRADNAQRSTAREEEPLPGAPRVAGATGPDQGSIPDGQSVSGGARRLEVAGPSGEAAPADAKAGARAGRSDAVGFGDDGRQFTGFFSNISLGLKGRPNTKPYEPVLDVGPIADFIREYNSHRGNFDDHIATSIPGFREVQTIVGSAIAKTYEAGDMLDIGASEGALIKAISKTTGGRVRTLALDPNFAMAKHFRGGERVPGAEYDTSAFGMAEQAGQEAWTEGDSLTDRDGSQSANPFAGEVVRYFNPGNRQFDVIHEAMVFQFIDGNRAGQVGRAKELMKPDGVLILEEKFVAGGWLTPQQFRANEEKKDAFKEQYFTKAEIAAKAKAVGVAERDQHDADQQKKESATVGMNDLMATPEHLEQVLGANFKHVVQFWDSGNFKGYMASDSRAAADKLLGNMLSTDSEFSTVQTPRVVTRTEGRVADAQRSAARQQPSNLISDIPSESWLEEQVEYAKERGRNRWGVPYMGKVTGRFEGDVMAPVSVLSKLKGQRDEQNNVRPADLAAIKRIMAETGKLPLNANGDEYVPYIEVNHAGEAWVSEGNHRIMAASELGLEMMPVQVRYFDGGERADGPMAPAKLRGADITRSTAREDAFAPNQIEQLLDKDGWAIMTAENPAAKQSSAADNASAMDALRADLRNSGASFQEVRGKYGNEENSLAITGIDEAQAIALGKKYGQESVLTRKGLVYQDGSITPATGITKYATAPDDFYSKIGDTIFSIGLDFDVRVTPQDVKLSKSRDDQYEGHLNDGSSVQKHSAGGLYPYVVVARDAKDGDGYEYGLIGPDTDGYVWIGSWEQATDSAVDRKVARELRNSKRSPAREQEPSKIFGRELAPLAKKAYESLGGLARNAVDQWNVNWHTGAMEQAFREDSAIAKEINAAFEPVRAKMREIYGDTIPMYRGEENEEVSRDDLQQRQLLSWTPLKALGRQFAMSGYIEPKPITDEEINRVVKQYEESGYVKYRGKRYIVNRQNPDYYNIYDSARQPITDGDDLEASLRDDKAWIDDQTAERKSGGRLYFAGVPVSDTVWIPVNGNLAQPEVIAKYNPRTRAAKDVQLSPAREPIFYSQLELALESVPDRLATMAAPQWKLWLDANAPKFGVKKEEIEWSGIKDYLSMRGKDKVTKDELTQYMRDSGVKVNDVVMGAGKEPDFAVDDFIDEMSDKYGVTKLFDIDGNVNTIKPDFENLLDKVDRDRYAAIMAEQGPKNEPATRYDQYTVPGGENYREILITLPSEAKLPEVQKRIAHQLFENGELVAQGDELSASRWRAANPEADIRQLPVESQHSRNIRAKAADQARVYQSGHWDQPNVLAHIRVDDRVDADGKKVLFINEIQSDWGADARKKGVLRPDENAEERNSVRDRMNEVQARARQLRSSGMMSDEQTAEYRELSIEADRLDERLREISAPAGVPAAPFIEKTESWVALALKRAIVMAAQNGYDKVAIITGEQAADNFDLSKSVKRIGWDPQRIDGRTQKRVSIAMQTEADIEFYVNEKGVIDYVTSSEDHEYLSDKPLVDVVGKDIAERILQSSQGLIQDEGLKIGGEGMRAFYDKIVPQVANDVLKKIGGGKVIGVDLSAPGKLSEREYDVYDADQIAEMEADMAPVKSTNSGFDITPAMREKLQGGAPLFSRARESAFDQTDTPAFKDWFGNSKVVDAEGKPMVVYHSSTFGDFSTFDKAKQHKGMAGYGFYFSDADGANIYADYGANFQTEKDWQGNEKKLNIMPVYLAIKNPLVADNIAEVRSRFGKADPGNFGQGRKYGGMSETAQTAIQRAGYDGVIANEYVTRQKDGSYKVVEPGAKGAIKHPVYVAFEPNQIKSALGNRGTFDPKDSDITRSRYREFNLANGYKVADLLDSSKTVSWWDETVGTPYHLAEKHPQFKRVYDAVQRFISDVSKYATRAADLAPNILPKLENLKDVFKSPLSAADVAALADPIFKGTLSYARDDQGKPVLTSDVGAAGVVWKDDELKSMWKLDDRQIGLYREFRRATNKSISDMATTHMVRYVGKDGDAVRDQVLAAPTVKAAYQILADHLAQLALATPGRADSLQNTVKTLKDTANMAQGLIAKGYAPLSRFGDYTVYVTRDGGKEQVFFGMYETEREANRAAREFKNDPKFADATIATGTMSKEASKLFKGITPETLALFGEALGLEESASDQESQVFQEYLKLAKANRSAMKHMIERKGIAGYSEDAGRVLASFVYSNARQSSTNLNAGEMIKSASEVQQGDLKDQAIKLVDYVQNPQEEAQTIRGMLFAQYIGGSIASALVNTTQSITTTWPTLSMYFGVGKAGKAMASALPIVKNGAGNDTELAAAMKRAEEEGVTAPQETHQLMAQAAGRGQLRSGDGTLIGDTLAKAKNSLAKVQMVWGKGFGFAELLNRQIAFVSAFNLAREKGMEDPYSFAKKIVAETQYVMNKGNNPSWARGPVGATLFTFRKFMINYLEGLARMWGGGPEGKKAFALSLAIMFMMAGVGGFPFADDLDDIIDGFAQRVLNKSFSSKLEKKQFFAKILGDAGADFVLSGISGLPGVPVDFSGRLGLGNIAPGTGLFVKKQDHTRDVKDIAGAGGDFINRMVTATGALAQGDMRAAFQNVVPIAIGNALKAKQMAELGYYQDLKGRKVIDTTLAEAALKGIGFQPQSVKKVQDATGVQQGLVALNKIRETEIADLWARGRIERKPDLVEDARRQLQEWNQANPQSPITINTAQITKRVQQANMDKAQRIAATAPKEIRKDVKAALDSDLAKQ